MNEPITQEVTDAAYWHRKYVQACRERDQYKQIAELNAETIKQMQDADDVWPFQQMVTRE